MEARPLDAAERAIREACAAGRTDEGTTAALRRYGPEVLGFLVGVHGDYDVASEAFARFSERLWQSLPQFEWRCSLRTWCYRLARNAAIDVQAHGARRAQGRSIERAGADESCRAGSNGDAVGFPQRET